MTRAKLLPVHPHEIAYHSWNSDSRRNALGIVRKDDIPSFLNDFIAACNEAGVEASSRIQRIGHFQSQRFEMYSASLQKEIDELNKRPVGVLGLFLEPVVIVNPDGTKHEDPDRMVVWIYFTIKKKALTRFRKFLISHVISIVEP
jgi:hypothetical protein